MKKRINYLIAALLCCTALTPSIFVTANNDYDSLQVSSSFFVNGDLNGDNSFSLKDVTTALEHALFINTDSLQMKAIGKSDDYNIALSDCSKLLKAALGIEKITTVFPIPQITEEPPVNTDEDLITPTVTVSANPPKVTRSPLPTPTLNPETVTEYSDIWIQIIDEFYSPDWFSGTIYMYKSTPNLTKADRQLIKDTVEQKSNGKTQLVWLRDDYDRPEWKNSVVLSYSVGASTDDMISFYVGERTGEYSAVSYIFNFVRQNGRWIYDSRQIVNDNRVI